MIYFLPNDRPFQQAVVDSMKVTIRQIQTFYADQMAAHGYGRKTFRFETDALRVIQWFIGWMVNTPIVTMSTMVVVIGPEISEKFDTRANNVYWIVWDNSVGHVYGAARKRLRGEEMVGLLVVPAVFYLENGRP